MKRLFVLLATIVALGTFGVATAGAASAIEVRPPTGELLEGVRYELQIVNTSSAEIELEPSSEFPGQFGTLYKESKRSSWSLLETTCPVCLLPGEECGQPLRYVGGQFATADWKIKYRTPCLREEEKEGPPPKQKKGKGKTRFG